MTKKIFFLSLIALFALSADGFAAKRYWIATTTQNWNSTTNWSATSAGASGASVPGSSDTAYFDGNRNGSCTINAAVDVKRLEVISAYSGTISQGSNTITIGTGNCSLSSGTFTGGSSAFTCNGSLTIAGTAFTSTSNTLTCVGNFSRTSGSFTHNSGTVLFTTSNTIGGTIAFNNLTFTPAANATHVISNTITVDGTLTTSGSNMLTLNTGTIDARGNVTVSNTGSSGGGNATITLSGTSTVNFDGNATTNRGRLPHVTISKTGGTVTLLDTISVAGNWTCSSAANAYLVEGTSTLYLAGSKTISGAHTLNNVFVDGGTYAMGTSDTVRATGLLKYVGSTSITINTGTFIAQGDITLANTGTTGGGTGLIFIRGTAVQTFTGIASVSNNSLLPNVEFKKDGGSITLAQVLPVRGNWTYTRGNTIHGTSTVGFNATKTIAGSDTLYNVIFAGAAATFTISSGTTLYTTGTLSTMGSNALTVNTGTIKALGDITLSNSSTSSGGSATVLIGGSGSQTLTGSGTAGGGALPNVTITKSGGTLSFVSIITCAGNWLYTAGTISPGISTVAFAGSYNLDGYEGGSAMPFYNVLIYSGTRTLTDHLDVNNNLTINGGTTLDGSSRTINVGGDWSNSGTFTSGTSTVVFDGVKYNTLSRAGAVESFYNLTFNRAYDSGVKKSVKLGSRVDVTNTLILTQGRIKTTSTFYLRLTDNATCSGGSDIGYVDGPMRKLGNDAFTFPLGDTVFADTASYHPMGITAPSSSGDEFQAEYKGTVQTVGATLVDTLESVSSCDHWVLDRTVGSSDVKATLGWHENCPPAELALCRVAMWDGSKWVDAGAASKTINWPRGTVTAALNMTFVSGQATLALSASKPNYRAYAVLKKKLDGNYYRAVDAMWFKFDDEYNDGGTPLTYSIRQVSTNNVITLLPTANNLQVSQYGDNRFKIDLYDNTGTALPSGYYVLEVINEKNEKWYLRFKIN